MIAVGSAKHESPLLTACGRMAKSARRSSPRPSRRFAKRAMEQRAFVPIALVCLRGGLLDVSRLLGMTLRPSAPVRCCHRDSLTRGRLALAQEAARDASSSSSHLFLRLISHATSWVTTLRIS